MSQSAAKGRAVPGPAPFRSLLVPIDLTPISDRILGRLALLPLADDARVTLLHVVPGSIPPADARDAERDAHKALATEERHLRKSLPRGVTVTPIVRFGSPAGEISACAKKEKVELIVMGRGGRRPVREAFLGSTAERVLRQTQLPVLVVRLSPRAAYSRPALALDLDELVHEIVRLMLRVLPQPRPRVTVVHAYDVPYRGPTYPSLTEGNKAECHDVVSRKMASMLADALARANVKPADAPGWKNHIRYGSPALVVEKIMKTSHTDLLVLGTHGYAGAAYLFLGTVAGDLLRRAQCDVLVAPFKPAA